jgi:hypothetical protein
VLTRTRELDVLKAAKRDAQISVERLDKELLDSRQALAVRQALIDQSLRAAGDRNDIR